MVTNDNQVYFDFIHFVDIGGIKNSLY